MKTVRLYKNGYTALAPEVNVPYLLKAGYSLQEPQPATELNDETEETELETE